MANTAITLLLILSFSLLPPPLSALPRRSLRGNPSSTVAQFLNSHNAVRAKHYLPPLKWSTPLANYAKQYANQRRGDCALVHSSANYGENIFWGGGSGWKPSEAVGAWAAQEAYYNYGSNSCMPGKDCLHYTQLVWRSTTSVGCAKIKCGRGDTYVVCEYYPHGNVMGQRPY